MWPAKVRRAMETVDLRANVLRQMEAQKDETNSNLKTFIQLLSSKPWIFFTPFMRILKTICIVT